MRFVLADLTNGATTADGGALTPAILAQIAAAATIYLNRDVSSAWGGNYTVRAGAGAGDLQAGEIPFAILSTLPDAPGAIAYHSDDSAGNAQLFDGITLSDSLIGAGNSLSVAITHELAETAGDAACNAWRDDGQGNEFAQELCDAVEEQSYEIDGVAVSNFLLPSFFTPGAVGPYDFLSTNGGGNVGPAGPMATTPGGYQIVRSAGQGEHQVQAITVGGPGKRFLRRAAKRAHASSRQSRRGLRT
jgi:hypothetical protein